MSSLTSLKTSNEETTMAPDAAVSEYTIVVGYNSRNNQPQDIVKEVNALIKEGWRPQGGIGLTKSNASTTYYQALVR